MTNLLTSGVPEIYDILRCKTCDGLGEIEDEPGLLRTCAVCLGNKQCPECTSALTVNAMHNFFEPCPVCGFQTQTDLIQQAQAHAAANTAWELSVGGETVLAVSPDSIAGEEEVNDFLLREIIAHLQSVLSAPAWEFEVQTS